MLNGTNVKVPAMPTRNEPKPSNTQASDPPDDVRDLMIVGIGASAGGVPALRDFFSHVKPDDGFAYVIVLHMSPQHESNLAAVLQSHATIPVIQATEMVDIEPNHAYVIPPQKYLILQEGKLRLVEPERTRGGHTSINMFFRTLADGYGKDAVAVILSGTGTDGTLGVRRIKENGGITIVQAPSDAEYDSMPRSAIDTGLVDLVLPVTEIPAKLRALRAGAARVRLLPGRDLESEKPRGAFDAESLRDVLTLLRLRTGHDFSQYRIPTLLRRIGRRIQVHELDDIASYLKFVREHPEEVLALLRDLLITVTNFFRDREAFEVLEHEIVPKLFADKTAEDQIRVWVAGCATGEEPYSIAMLLCEYAETLPEPPKLQVFATDIDERAIAEARECRYPQSITLDVTPERLKRFFIREGEFFRIRKELRELVLFAPHNLLRDPPFSKLDLISCRNLLIYLNREVQERILSIFHFALRPSGYLFLGASDSAEGVPHLFSPLNKKHRAYVRRNGHGALAAGLPNLPISQEWLAHRPSTNLVEGVFERPVGLGELHHRVIEQLAPPSVLIDENYDIVHLSEHAGRYLQFAGGEPSRNLLRVVHPDLRLELRAALFAFKGRPANSVGELRSVRVRLDEQPCLIHLGVRPVLDLPPGAHGYFLVTFDETAATPPDAGRADTDERDGGKLAPVVAQLEEELQRNKDQLRLTIEQYETSTEELKASNEELQAINEELRSATEELETSKEELQSVNEELTTVNQEYREKIDEVSRANSDLQNLMASTDIGTIFLDRNLQIKRYTPAAQRLFNITEADIGRPLEHFTHKLTYPALAEDAERVLRTLHAEAHEVPSTDGRWFLARMLLYRTMDDRIDGTVLTFVDITERRHIEDQLRQQAAQLQDQARILDQAQLIIRDPQDRVVFWNAGAESLYGYVRGEALGQVSHLLLRSEFPVPLEQIRAELLSGGEWNGQLVHHTRDGTTRVVASRWVLFRDEQGEPYRILEVNTDITERRRAEEALEDSEGRMREMLEGLPFLVWTATVGGQVDFLGPQWLRYTGTNEATQLGDGWLEQLHPEDREGVVTAWQQSLRESLPLEVQLRIRGADGDYRWFQTRAIPLRDRQQAIVKWLGTSSDITASKQAEEDLLEADRHKNEFLALLSHELRNPLAPIQTSVHLLEHTATLEAGPRKALTVIKRQADQLTYLVNELLDLARVNRGKIVLDRTLIELEAVVNDAIDTVRPQIEARQHHLATDLPDVPVTLFGDQARLVQVLSNLLGNAAKFTPNGGHIELRVALDGEQLSLRVHDDGIGISPESLPSIFDPFLQGPRSAGRFESGLGVGLYLTKQIVGLHGGSIEAHSEGAGQGTEFVVKLPASSGGESLVPDRSAPVIAGRRRRILVVDDNRDAAETLTLLFELTGHEVTQAYDGPSALDAAAAFHPDVVVLDIGLPGLDGFEVARRLRQRAEMRDCLLIALSGYSDPETLERSRAAGFNQHLVKPVQQDTLLAALA